MLLKIPTVGLLLFIGHLAQAQVGISLPIKKNECPQFQQILNAVAPQQALNEALKIKRLCARAEALYSLAFEASGSRDFNDFIKYGPRQGFKGNGAHEVIQRKLVDTLLVAGDTVETINQANVYIDYYSQLSAAMDVHFKLLLAQDARILEARRSQSDTYVALGLNPEQIKYRVETVVLRTPGGTTITLDQRQIDNSQFDEHLYRRSFASFLEKYGNRDRNYSEVVMQMLDKASIRAQEKELEVGLYYYKQKEYIAAIGRFKRVTDSGPVMMFTEGGQANFEVWDEAAYYTALSFMELGNALLNLRSKTVYTDNVKLREAFESIIWIVNKKSMLITDNRIADWLRIDRQQYNPEKNRNQPSRQDLARISFQNIGMIVSEMKNARGKSAYRARLERDLKRKMTPEIRSLVPDLDRLLQL
jgi:outer membrane protein assembly factor BamD (BamD/ComL family)